jgi:gluconolactonase
MTKTRRIDVNPLPNLQLQKKPAARPPQLSYRLAASQTFPRYTLAMTESVGRITRNLPAFDELVAPDAHIERLATGFGFTEGPVWVEPPGYLLFSDIPHRTIHKWSPQEGVSVYRHPIGYTGPEPPPGAQPGPNGLTLDAQQRLIVCEHGNRRLIRLEHDGAITVLASHYQGKRLNSPNDVVCRRTDGSIYFTDPPYGLPEKEDDPARELTFSGVYRCTEDGDLQLLYDGFRRPNGLAFSPDESVLYVGNSEIERRVWLRFELRPDGTLHEPTVFFDATGHPGAGNPDGFKVDVRGNLYCTGPGGVWIFDPQGNHLGTIEPPEIPANCHWGDADARTLYITARTSLYRVRLGLPGVRTSPVTI